MAQERKPIDVSSVPELLRLAREVRDSGESRVLAQDDEELAVLSPVQAERRRTRKSGVVTRSDSLWDIVGTASSAGPGDVARNKHKYLAEAYADKHA
jgi:hypothetical protein